VTAPSSHGVCVPLGVDSKRRYFAHWLRSPSPSFDPDWNPGADPEVFAAHLAPPLFTSCGANSRRVTFPFRVSPDVPVGPSSECPTCPHGVSSPSTFWIVWSPLHPSLPHPVRCAFRLSQPLDALLLQTPSGLVSCR
jgi:hypothetical protein